MKLVTPEISWHTKEPVYSVDFHRSGPHWRFATAGADNDVRIWSLSYDGEKAKVSYVATLSRHAKAVNVVRFSPDGEFLASSGDDNAVLLWKLSESMATGAENMEVGGEENKEMWTVVKMLRGHLEDVYDLYWSCDSKYMVSGSVDNKAIIWDVQKGQHICILGESKQYVQGVAWDPRGQWVVTHSNDRSMRVYSIQQKFKCTSTVNRVSLPGENAKQHKMFLDESASSFFRRLAFTPDGSLLIVPAGCIEVDCKPTNVTYVFSRNNLTKPVLYLPALDKPTVIVRCCPVLFELRTSSQVQSHPPLFDLQYRMVYSIASVDSVMIYDTQSPVPFAYITNAHYAGITDMAWSNDGLALIVSSSDGFCSIVTFSPGEIGTPLSSENMPCFPNGTSAEPATPVSNKKGSAGPKFKPRKICLAPANSPNTIEGTQVEPKAEIESEVSGIEADKKGKCSSMSSTPATSGLKRLAFVTLCKDTGKTHLGADSCAGSGASSVVKTSMTSSPTSSGVKSADTAVSFPPATLKVKSRRVDFVTLTDGTDTQPSLQGAQGGSTDALSPAPSLGVKPSDIAVGVSPAAPKAKPRRVDFVTLSKDTTKLHCAEAGSSKECGDKPLGSKDADNASDKTFLDHTEPMEVVQTTL